MSRRDGFEARGFFCRNPPLVDTSGKGITVLATGTAAVIVDLTTLPGLQTNRDLDISNDLYNPNPIGRRICLQANGQDCYVAFAKDVASLGSLSATAVSTVSSNAVTQVAGGCIIIPAGAVLPSEFQLPPDFETRDRTDYGKASLARYLGFLTATSTGFLRIWQSGP